MEVVWAPALPGLELIEARADLFGPDRLGYRRAAPFIPGELGGEVELGRQEIELPHGDILASPSIPGGARLRPAADHDRAYLRRTGQDIWDLWTTKEARSRAPSTCARARHAGGLGAARARAASGCGRRRRRRARARTAVEIACRYGREQVTAVVERRDG